MRNSITLIIILYCTLLFSQNNPVTVSKSEVFKEKRLFENFAFVVDDNDGGVLVGRKTKHSRLVIEHYTKDLKLIASNPFEDKIFVSDAFLKEDILHVIEIRSNFDTNDLEAYIVKIPLSDFSIKKELLFTIPAAEIGKRGMPWGNNRGPHDFDYRGITIKSKNDNFFVSSIDIENREMETHRLFVYDNSVNKKYQIDFKRNIEDKNFKIAEMYVNDDNGEVYILGKIFLTEEEEKQIGGNYYYELYRVTDTTELITTFYPKEKYVGYLKISVDKNKLNCVGFYSDDEKYQFRHRYKGIVNIEVDLKDNNSEVKFSPFSEEFLAEKYGKNKKKDLNEIEIKEIIHKKDGGHVIIGEDTDLYEHKTTNYGTGSEGYERKYYYKDITYVALAADGKVIQSLDIDRNLTSDYFSQYKSVISTYDKETTTMYIPSSSKIKKDKDGKIEFKEPKSSNAILVALTVDEKGNFQYKKVYDFGNSDLPFYDVKMFKTTEGLIITNQKKNKKQFLNVKKE